MKNKKDNLEINEKTKKEIGEARKRIQTGKFITQEQIEKDLLFTKGSQIDKSY